MSKIEEITRPRLPIALNWPTALSLLTALVASGTITLHLIGAVSHRQYLRYWGIDAGLFPKTTDWILINGYYSVVDRSFAILIAMLSNWRWLVPAAFILGMYVFILLLPSSGASVKSPAWLLRQPERLRRFIRQVLLTVAFVSLVPCALYLLTASMVVPAALGEIAGRSAAENESLQYRKGCQLSTILCVELKREGEIIATGFVLDSSPSHIAIFDAQTQRGRVLAMDNLEMMSNRTPYLKKSVGP